MGIGIIGWVNQINIKIKLSKMISLLIIANFLLIFIKGEDYFDSLIDNRKILSNIEDEAQHMIMPKDNYNQEQLFSLEHFEVNFQRILKLSDQQISYFQPYLSSYVAVDEDYKSINKSLFH
jgi:hypothetical protein